MAEDGSRRGRYRKKWTILGAFGAVVLVVGCVVFIFTFTACACSKLENPIQGEAQVEQTNDGLRIAFVSNQNAEYVNVTVSEKRSTVARFRLNSTGQVALVNSSGIYTGIRVDDLFGSHVNYTRDVGEIYEKGTVEGGDVVTVTITGVNGENSVVLIHKTLRVTREMNEN